MKQYSSGDKKVLSSTEMKAASLQNASKNGLIF